MSFEDDEYWEAEYSDQALPYADSAAVARDNYADRIPHSETPRRPAGPRPQWVDDEFDEDEGYDELAARRQRRQAGYSRSPDRQKRIKSAFDAERPDWLDDPGFAHDLPPIARDLPPVARDLPPVARDLPPVARDLPPVARETAPPREERWRRRSAPARVDHVREEDWNGLGERGRPLDDDWDSLVEYVEDRPTGRPDVAWTDDEDYGQPIRPPGGRRSRRVSDPDDPREADQRPPRTGRPATGRARVPEPSVDEALDLYRPPKDAKGRPRDNGRVEEFGPPDDPRSDGVDDVGREAVGFRPDDERRATNFRPDENDRDGRRRRAPARPADGIPDDVLQGELLPPDPRRQGRWNDPHREKPRRDIAWAGDQSARAPQRDERLDERGPRAPRRDERLDERDPRAPRRDERLDERDPRAPRRDERLDERGPRAPRRDERLDERDPRAPRRDERLDERGPRAPRRDERLDERDPRAPRRDERLDERGPRAPRRDERLDERDPRAPRRDQRLDERDRPEQPARPAVERPVSPAAAAPDAVRDRRPAAETPGDGDGPRVLNKATPPAAPRVLSKATPPPAPRVIKKADPPATPRVVNTTPQAAPPRVVVPPLAAQQPAAGVRPEPTPINAPRPGQNDGDPAAQRQAPAAAANTPTAPQQVDAVDFPSTPAAPAWHDLPGADSLGSDRLGADPLGTDPLGTDPLGTDPLGTDPLGTDPLGTDPLGTDPLGTDPLGTDPLGTDPLGTDPLGTDPLGTDPLGTDPLGTDPLGTDPLGTDRLDASLLGADRLDADSLGRDRPGAGIQWDPRDLRNAREQWNPREQRQQRDPREQWNPREQGSQSEPRKQRDPDDLSPGLDPLGMPAMPAAPMPVQPAAPMPVQPAAAWQAPAAADPRDIPPGSGPLAGLGSDRHARPVSGAPQSAPAAGWRAMPDPADPSAQPSANPWATPSANPWAPAAQAMPAAPAQQPVRPAPAPQPPRHATAPGGPAPQQPRHRPAGGEAPFGSTPREVPPPAYQREMQMPAAPRDRQPVVDPRTSPPRPAPAARPGPEQVDRRAMPDARFEQPMVEPRRGHDPSSTAVPPIARARVEPMAINGYPAVPGTHAVDTPFPRAELTRQLPRKLEDWPEQPGQAALGQQPGYTQPGQTTPSQQPSYATQPGQTTPSQQAAHAAPDSRPAAAEQSAASAAGTASAAGIAPTQLTPPAPGDRPSAQTITNLPLLPIGRIATSGPDTAPKRYQDQGLGANWFSAKTPAEPTTPKPSEPSPSPSGGSDNPADTGTGLVIDLDLTGLLAGNPTGEQPVVVPGRDPAVDAGPTLPFRRSKKSQSAPPDPAPPTTTQAAPPNPAPTANTMQTAPPHPAPTANTAQTAPPHPAPTANTMQTAPPAPAVPATPPPALAPALPPEGTAAGRAGVGGQHWAARDETEKPSPDEEPAEAKAPLRPLRPLPADDLAAIRWRLDGGTLREVVDDRDALRELGLRLDEPLTEETDNVARAGLLCVRAEVYRLLDELGMAAAASRLALAHAESSDDVQATVIAQAELAHVLRLRGDFAEADRLFEEAASSEAPEELRSVVHENAGRSCFDQGRHMEALDHFARAVRLGRADDTDLVERIDVSLEAVYIHALRDGWGPYPRLRREIIGLRKS